MPVFHQNRIYLAGGGDLWWGKNEAWLKCVDAETGKPLWTHEIKGEAWASPLVADGKVYLGTRSGNFYVFAATKAKKVLTAIELGNPISATATAANGVLYVATMTHLFAIQATAK